MYLCTSAICASVLYVCGFLEGEFWETLSSFRGRLCYCLLLLLRSPIVSGSHRLFMGQALSYLERGLNNCLEAESVIMLMSAIHPAHTRRFITSKGWIWPALQSAHTGTVQISSKMGRCQGAAAGKVGQVVLSSPADSLATGCLGFEAQHVTSSTALFHSADRGLACPCCCCCR